MNVHKNDIDPHTLRSRQFFLASERGRPLTIYVTVYMSSMYWCFYVIFLECAEVSSVFGSAALFRCNGL